MIKFSKISILVKVSVGGSLLLSSAVFAPCVLAQDGQDSLFSRDRNISVTQRERPEYQSEGVRRGAFVFRPLVNLQTLYSDNIFANNDDRVDDLIVRLNPSIDVLSDWSRHELRGHADLDHNQFIDNSNENTTSFTLGVNSRYDASSRIDFRSGAEFSRGFERRSVAGAAFASQDPIQFDDVSFNLGTRYESGRARIGIEGSLRDINYEDGVDALDQEIDQDFRDFQNLGVRARTEYALSPTTAVFVQGEYSDVSHDDLPLSGITRDRQNISGRVGADFEVSNLIRGQVGVGFFNSQFSSDVFNDVDGLSFDGRVEWFATPLITVTGYGHQGIRPSELLVSPATTEFQLGLQVDYEYRRNIIFSAGYEHTVDDYSFIDRDDQRDTAYFSGIILFNPNIGIQGRVSHQSLDSEGLLSQPNFDETRVSFGVVLRL